LLAVKSSPKAAGAAGSVLFTVWLPAKLPPRNTCVRVNIKAVSLHGPRLRQPSSSLVCVPEAAHRLAVVIFAPTARSLNKLFYGVRPISLDSILSASNSERWFKSGAVAALKPVAPLSKFSREN